MKNVNYFIINEMLIKLCDDIIIIIINLLDINDIKKLNIVYPNKFNELYPKCLIDYNSKLNSIIDLEYILKYKIEIRRICFINEILCPHDYIIELSKILNLCCKCKSLVVSGS